MSNSSASHSYERHAVGPEPGGALAADVIERYAIQEPEVGWEEHDRIIAEQRAEEERRERETLNTRRMFSMGVPRKHHGPILAGLEPREPVLAMRAFHKEVRAGRQHLSVLHGWAGVGKSVAAAAWLLHATGESERRPRVRARRFIAAAHYCRISDFDTTALAAIEQACFLVIDDLGLEFGDKRQYYASRIDALINQRHADMLPTVVTTNVNMQKIYKEYGDRVESRFSEYKITYIRDKEDLRKRPAATTGSEPGKP